MCLVPIAQSLSDDTLERTVRRIVPQALARQLATGSTNVTRPSLQSDICELLKQLTETINKFGSKLESVEAAVNLRPSSCANASASFRDAQADLTAVDPDEYMFVPKNPATRLWGIGPVSKVISTLDRPTSRVFVIMHPGYNRDPLVCRPGESYLTN